MNSNKINITDDDDDYEFEVKHTLRMDSNKINIIDDDRDWNIYMISPRVMMVAWMTMKFINLRMKMSIDMNLPYTWRSPEKSLKMRRL